MASILPASYVASSSGVNANPVRFKTSEPFARAIADVHDLEFGLHDAPVRTTDGLLAQADIIVFMHKDVHDEANQKYHFDARKATIWNVSDISAPMHARYIESDDLSVVTPTVRRTFIKIQNDCDDLLKYVTAGSWVDVVDQANIETGLRLPISWVNDRGLWHRGIHVVARTTDGKFLVGKRASGMVFAPGMLEISLGGAVDTGEAPLHAAVRESQEETGITMPTKHFYPLFVRRTSNYHPHYKKLSRVHAYVYVAQLPVHSLHFKPQPGEVDELRLVTRRDIRSLLRNTRLRNFGRLSSGHKLYQKAVAMSTLPF